MIQELLERVFPRMNDRNSRQDVKNRLRLVLAHDRADLNPELIEAIRRDILEVLSRYVDLDADTMEMTLENNNRMTALVANLPIRRVKAEFYTVKESPTETLPEMPLDESAIGDPKLGEGLAIVPPSQVQRSQPEIPAEPIVTATSASPTIENPIENPINPPTANPASNPAVNPESAS